MHFVGIDLAWGERKPSGLAVLDAHGRLVHVSTATTDETIEAALAPWTAGDCLVAVDAPLIVVNETGNRPCEAELNRDFRAYEAGAHPANRGKPELADTPRGARLAARLGLDIDPVSASSRRAIEVYPHPATVALFDLPRTLKYKAKPGRTLEEMRGELLRLVELLESLEHSPTPLLLRHSEEWRTLREGVVAAASKADLRRCEDPVDAVVCAYVALFATRRPRETTTYGDGATGYIVTPTLPALVPPTVAEERAAAAAAPGRVAEPVARAVQDYAALQPTLLEPTRRWTEAVTTLLDDAGINYLSVAGRTKSVASFAAKAMRAVDGGRAQDDPMAGITDQIGVRVITYVHADVAAVAQLFADQLVVLDDRDLGEETASEGRFGYASRHLLVRAPDDALEGPGGLGPHPASVQVRTVLQHAWAEFEHDIRYKGTIPDEHVSDLDRRFTLAAGLLELADREFEAIRDRLRTAAPEPADADPADPTDPRISAQELASFLTGQYADAGWSRTDHYAWIAGLLLELGITGLDELAALLGSVDTGAIIARMGYRYPAGAVRRLDDALLAIFGERYVALHGNAHRTALLRARLARLTGEPA